MKFRPTALAEVVVLTPETWFNQLGYFRESFRQEEFEHYYRHYSFIGLT